MYIHSQPGRRIVDRYMDIYTYVLSRPWLSVCRGVAGIQYTVFVRINSNKFYVLSWACTS